MPRQRVMVAIATLLIGAYGCARGGPPASAPTVTESSTDGFYTPAQVARGREIFRESCSECHSVSADFRGREFEWNWRRRTAWQLFNSMKETMPEDFPGLLTDQAYADVIAYVLDANGYASGATELEPTEEAMGGIPLGPGARKTRRVDESQR